MLAADADYLLNVFFPAIRITTRNDHNRRLLDFGLVHRRLA